ncbi:YdaU family protein [Nitrosospira sp. Is2]|uniref:YdaU family protein n=1 Tax=Nitrosospira sp. Is2 TaxID=3080532 RepID=UPI002955D63E|nr:YdaU family protein [Nitrosospira sp. Is2]WON73869.1 YdaU family protein [Nitrosospira sp. Is2]
MNYYERYCGDYQRDTAHLSLAEHGAYTMLLDTYFSVEKPLPSDMPSLYRVCRAMTRLEQQAVKSVAEQFFPVSAVDGFRHNQRADREIAKARPKIEAARNNGRKGGRPPRQSALQQETENPTEPGGLATGFRGITPNTTCDISGHISTGSTWCEPGGKAHQHQHQHQRQPGQNAQGDTGRAVRAVVHATGGQRGVADAAPDPDSCPHEHDFAAAVPRETKTCDPSQPGIAGACCKVLIRLGVQGCNPHHPVLLALLDAGAVEDEFAQAARNAVARGKASFAYVLGTVKRQREEAAKLVLHRGRMPNIQELLESSNRAAADGWVPPELRQADARADVKADVKAHIEEAQHGN